jgi:hypothetical protein
MLNQEIDSNHNWIPIPRWHSPGLTLQKPSGRKSSNLLEQVPVMSATVLGLEILLNEPCIDLRMASDLVLSDVGATLQVLRLVRNEYEFATEPLSSMGDCLAGLDASTWFHEISARTFACDDDHIAITSLYYHCRLVARYARLVAESLQGVSPEEAYLVGLLHEMETLPTTLGWPSHDLQWESSLPPFVLAAMRSADKSSSAWKFILKAAHELAADNEECDPSAIHDFGSVGITCSRPFLPVTEACVCAGL